MSVPAALQSPPPAAVPPSTHGGSRWRVPSLAVAGIVAGASFPVLLMVLFAVSAGRSGGYVGSYAFSIKVMLAVVGLVAATGLVAALIIALTAVRRRATSLRTRAFFVIAAAVLIPSFCLGALGVWAYYRSWETAGVLYTDQAAYQRRELSSEIAELGKMPGRFTPAERALLSRAIANHYGALNHSEGAYWSTLPAVRDESVLPLWAVRSLERRGFAIGGAKGPTSPEGAEIVAWRVGPSKVRYYTSSSSASQYFGAYAPFDRLLWIGLLGLALIAVLGLLGAWILSRSVVRPVRRLAEASHRIADARGAGGRPDAAPQDGGGWLGCRRQRPRAPGRLQPGRERDPLHAAAGGPSRSRRRPAR